MLGIGPAPTVRSHKVDQATQLSDICRDLDHPHAGSTVVGSDSVSLSSGSCFHRFSFDVLDPSGFYNPSSLSSAGFSELGLMFAMNLCICVLRLLEKGS